jgi:hypothetical protein
MVSLWKIQGFPHGFLMENPQRFAWVKSFTLRRRRRFTKSSSIWDSMVLACDEEKTMGKRWLISIGFMVDIT